MSANTVSVQATAAAYTLVASGQEHVALQLDSGASTLRNAGDTERVRVHVGQALPVADTPNYVTLKNGDPLGISGLALGDNVYVRAETGQNVVRVLSWTSPAQAQAQASGAALATLFSSGAAANKAYDKTADTSDATDATVLAANGEGDGDRVALVIVQVTEVFATEDAKTDVQPVFELSVEDEKVAFMGDTVLIDAAEGAMFVFPVVVPEEKAILIDATPGGEVSTGAITVTVLALPAESGT